MSNGILERKAHLFPQRYPLDEAGICCFTVIFSSLQTYLHLKPTGDA